ncbi:hypothetical protein TYRP_004202 [Tyrophagus putrescentiae]|nr:hypothetical protein TYRP_004202 [Tyrophagus putrescentiae]
MTRAQGKALAISAVVLPVLEPISTMLDEVINAQDGDRRLGGKLQTLHLGDGRLEDAHLHRVLHRALKEIQAGVLHRRVVRLRLGAVVVGAQLRHQVGGVLGGVHRQRLRNHQKRPGKLGNRQLLARANGGGKVLQVHGEGRLDGAPARDHLLRLEDALHGAQRVIERALHLVEEELVGAAQNDRRRVVNELIVADSLLDHLFRLAEHGRLKGLLALHVRQTGNQLAAGGLRYSLQVKLSTPPDRHDAALQTVLLTELIDAASGEDDISARVDDLQDALLGNVAFTGKEN